MSRIQCFLLVPTGNQRRSLRRFCFGQQETCPHGYHDASATLDVVPDTEEPTGDSWSHDDSRWPTKCDKCSYVFTEKDEWQLFHETEYRRSDTSEPTTLREASAGAMWWATWMSNSPGSVHHQAQGGGPHLILKTPAGDWDIDSKSSNGSGWTRTGEPPLVVARPSIGVGQPFQYHGFLGGQGGNEPGWLVEC